MSKKPIIGITLDSFNPQENEKTSWYSIDYWYALRSHYIEAVVQYGGIPFPLPHNNALIPEFIEKIDGLIITGGGLDVPPEYYNAKAHPKTRLKMRRSEFEKDLTLHFLKTKKPIFGICGGMQLLAALYGGELFQYLPEEGCYKEHTQDTPRDQSWHSVKIVKDTILSSIFDIKDDFIPVNSVHQQAVKNPGKMTVSAIADDGLIEAIEDSSHPFCVGVQWHPECFVSEYDHKLFDAFIKIAVKTIN